MAGAGTEGRATESEQAGGKRESSKGGMGAAKEGQGGERDVRRGVHSISKLSPRCNNIELGLSADEKARSDSGSEYGAETGVGDCEDGEPEVLIDAFRYGGSDAPTR